MSKDRLFVTDGVHGRFYIQWWLADDGCEGAILGDREYPESALRDVDPASYEHIKAAITASKTAGVARDREGYFWETAQQANAALKAVKTALKDKSDKPIPDWAVKALAEGWKPPKNWRK